MLLMMVGGGKCLMAMYYNLLIMAIGRMVLYADFSVKY